jgi:Alpha/beta hydrolase
MNIEWSELKAWQAAAVDDAERQVKLRVDELGQLADGLNWKHPAAWHGEASERARAERVRLVGIFDELEQETDPLKRALRTAADAITVLRRNQDEAEHTALRNEMIITAAGELLTERVQEPMPGTPEAQERLQLTLALRDEMDRILAQAQVVDDELAEALRRAAFPAKYPDAHGNMSRLNPPPNGTPAEINDWWLGLSEEERNELVETRPEWVGATDGIPAEYRDTANRQVLDSQRADLQAQLDDLNARVRANPLDVVELRDEINSLKAKLNGLDDIQNRLEDPGPGKPDAYLLGIDSANGQAIIAMGNPDTATNVATFVPGTGSGLDSINGDMSRADSMTRAADKAGSPSTAVITWAGYAAPQDLGQAAETAYAEDAKRDLDQFQDGLRATHEGARSHNTVIGHSYGSTVIGHAAASEGLDVDEAVFVGSPGVGVDDAADLNLPPEHVHATVAEHDVIQASNIPFEIIPGIDTDVHGPDPTGRDFGANVFESDPGTKGPDIKGGLSNEAHSQYWDDRNKALVNMGRIIAGKPTA